MNRLVDDTGVMEVLSLLHSPKLARGLHNTPMHWITCDYLHQFGIRYVTRKQANSKRLKPRDRGRPAYSMLCLSETVFFGLRGTSSGTSHAGVLEKGFFGSSGYRGKSNYTLNCSCSVPCSTEVQCSLCMLIFLQIFLLPWIGTKPTAAEVPPDGESSSGTGGRFPALAAFCTSNQRYHLCIHGMKSPAG